MRAFSDPPDAGQPGLRAPASLLECELYEDLGWWEAAAESAGRVRSLAPDAVVRAYPARLGSGLRLAAVYAPLGAVIGEWVGAGRGLGYLMLLANGRVKTDLLFAAVITVGVMSVTLYLLASALADRMEAWAGERRED